MNINSLIAQGGRQVKSPAERYLETKRYNQQEQINNVRLEGAKQQLGANNQAQKSQQTAEMDKRMANYAKTFDGMDDIQAEAKFEADRPNMQSLGLPPVPESVNYGQVKPRLEMAKQTVFGEAVQKNPDVKQFGSEDVMFQGGVEIGRTKTAKKSGQTINNVVGGKGDEEYWKKRLGGQATRMDELEKASESAFNEMKALDRFLASSKNTTEGGAQPVISGVKNILSSFGAKFDDLKDVAEMQQAVADIKTNYLKDLGARGLTDKDMEIINDALPKLATSRPARENIVRILKKAQLKTIESWENMREEEKRVYPDKSQTIFTPSWYSNYAKYSQQDDLSPEEVAELEARESIVKQPTKQVDNMAVDTAQRIERTDQ